MGFTPDLVGRVCWGFQRLSNALLFALDVPSAETAPLSLAFGQALRSSPQEIPSRNSDRWYLLKLLACSQSRHVDIHWSAINLKSLTGEANIFYCTFKKDENQKHMSNLVMTCMTESDGRSCRVSNYKMWSTVGQPLNRQQGHGHSRLNVVCGGQRLEGLVGFHQRKS